MVADGGTAEVKVYGFDASDSIDLTSFGDDLTTSVSGSDVEVSNARWRCGCQADWTG